MMKNYQKTYFFSGNFCKLLSEIDKLDNTAKVQNIQAMLKIFYEQLTNKREYFFLNQVSKNPSK